MGFFLLHILLPLDWVAELVTDLSYSFVIWLFILTIHMLVTENQIKLVVEVVYNNYGNVSGVKKTRCNCLILDLCQF